jgi:hypothetical protein
MTSIPRPALIGLVGLVVVVGVFMLTRSQSAEESVSPAPTPAAPAPAPAQTTAPSSANTTPADTAKAAEAAGPKATKSRKLPAPVQRALDKHRVLVLLFWNPRGTDDRSVKSAVDGISRRGGKVAVFTDKPENLARYTKITSAVDVTQSPTLIVVNRKGESRKATGYLDPVTADQYVVDALHGAP